jgi:alpha-ketoglutarate-dependent taurine dioxygenase
MFADHSGNSQVHDPDPDLEDYGYDTNDIVRITVMLEDWQPGQFIIYGNTVYQQWRAGDCHFFDWKNIPHATANASEHTRITLQVTGLRTALTDPKFNIRNFKGKQYV